MTGLGFIETVEVCTGVPIRTGSSNRKESACTTPSVLSNRTFAYNQDFSVLCDFEGNRMCKFDFTKNA
jgi:hypothetical protein